MPQLYQADSSKNDSFQKLTSNHNSYHHCGLLDRDLDRQWKICNSDGKILKLSPKQIAHLIRIEQGGDR